MSIGNFVQFDRRLSFLAFAIGLWIWIGYSIYTHSSKKIFKVVIVQSSTPLRHLDDSVHPIKREIFWVDRILFPKGDELRYPSYGYLGYRHDFKMFIDGDFILAKSSPVKFIIYSDDGVRLSIDGKKVLEFLDDRPFKRSEGEIVLKEGKHHLHIDYFQGYGQLGLVGYYQIAHKRKLLGQNMPQMKFLKQ